MAKRITGISKAEERRKRGLNVGKSVRSSKDYATSAREHVMKKRGKMSGLSKSAKAGKKPTGSSRLQQRMETEESMGIKRGKKAWKSGGFAQTRPKQKR